MTLGKVVRLGADADGVIERDRGPLFVRGALPGDVVDVGKERRDGKIDRATLRAVREPGSDRVASACPIYARCGGCPLMAASASLQASFKLGSVRRALEQAGVTIEASLTPAEPTLAYRSRARLTFERRGALSLGYRATGAAQVVDVERCAVLAPVVQAGLEWARAELGTLDGAGEIHVGMRGAPVIAVRTESAQPAEIYRALERGVGSGALAGASLSAGGASVAVTWGEPFEESVDVDGRVLRLPAGGFRQAHAQADALLGGAVLTLAAPEGARVLELHAGHGNFTLALASRAARVIAVEVAADAVAAARMNLSAHGLTARVDLRAAPAERVLAGPPSDIDVVVLDPPRTGARELVAPLVALGPTRIVYVSCAPSTLGRDLSMFRERGYVVDAALAFDLFPRTAHVETVVRLVRS